MDNSITGALIDGVFSKYTGKYTNAKTVDESDPSNSYMSFDSYLNLLVAQMSNQDFNNPMDDSEVLAQMAQYSMLEGIKNMTQQSSISYATSLVGKYVTISDNNGYITGKVDSISVSNGEPFLMIDGQPYKSSKVTDIVSDDIFNGLKDLVGKTVTFTVYEDGKEATVTQKVSDVVYVGGEGFAVVKGKLISVGEITVFDAAEAAGSGNSTETAEENSSDEEDGTAAVTEEATVTENTRATYSERSQSLIDSFMKELDEADKSNDTVSKTAAAEAKPAPAAVSMFSADAEEGELVVETAEVPTFDFAAGDRIMMETYTNTASGDIYANGDSAYRSSSVNAVNTNSAAAQNTSSSYGGKYGVNTVDRSNTAITSRIKTGEIIAYTNDGQPVTEIGYSGLGRLGDVITLANGTQRVKVNLFSGKSFWLETTGNYTIDELCSLNVPAGAYVGKLTLEESWIRHHSDIFDIDNATARKMFHGLY